ncbi:hypothetical protein HDU98_006080, partial [Podochytrium sp. JEL0797]
MWRKFRLSLLLSLVSTPPSIESRTAPTHDSPDSVRRAVNVLAVTDDWTPLHQRVLDSAGRMRRFAKWSMGSVGGGKVEVNGFEKEGCLA